VPATSLLVYQYVLWDLILHNKHWLIVTPEQQQNDTVMYVLLWRKPASGWRRWQMKVIVRKAFEPRNPLITRMDVCLLLVFCVTGYRPLWRANHPCRKVLPHVVRRCVWSINLVTEVAQSHWGLLNRKKGKINKTAGSRTCFSTTLPSSGSVPSALGTLPEDCIVMSKRCYDP
jgi:hypothetical protein